MHNLFSKVIESRLVDKKGKYLHRKDHDDVLSCVASNTNLTARPQITYININMVCKYLI